MPGKPLRLPTELQAALQWAATALDSWVSRTDYRMGGGSILAASWNHRRSTDIDLFFDRGATPAFPLDRIMDDFRAAAATGEVSDLRLYPHGLLWTRRGVPMSLFEASRLAVDDQAVPTVLGVGIPAEGAAEILAKKVRARMLRGQQYLARDMYDLLVAHVEDPNAAARVFECLADEERAMLRYDATHAPLPGNAGRAILDPAYPALLASPHALGQMMRLVLRRGLVGRELDRLRTMREDLPRRDRMHDF